MFESAPERFHGGIIVAVIPASHGDAATVAEQRGPIGCAVILIATIRIIKQTAPGRRFRLAMFRGGQWQRLRQARSRVPADQTAAVSSSTPANYK